MSHEYALSVAIVIGSVLQIFGIEMENKTLEGLVYGLAACWIAFRRFKKGDITIGGVRKN